MTIYSYLTGYVFFEQQINKLSSDLSSQIESLEAHNDDDAYISAKKISTGMTQESHILEINIFNINELGIDETLEDLLDINGALFFIYVEKTSNTSTPGEFFDAIECLEFNNNYFKKDYRKIKREIVNTLEIYIKKETIKDFYYDFSYLLEDKLSELFSDYLDNYDKYDISILTDLTDAIDLYDQFSGNTIEEINEMGNKISKILKNISE